MKKFKKIDKLDKDEYYESEERLLTKDEMLIANNYWKKYAK